jgi:hypothetical protein
MLAKASPALLRKLKAAGLDKPVAWDLGGPPRKRSDDEEDDENPADGVSIDRDPISEIEEPVQESELSIIADHFTAALIWASQAKTLIEMGWRIHTMLAVFRPVLIEGMALEVKVEMKRDLVNAIGSGRTVLKLVGEYYREVLAWCRRCNSLSHLGQRGFGMIYVMRRDLIPERNTNAALGALHGKTRQAFNKTVGDFRDSNRGFRNGVMREETTRTKCRIAQTSET